MDGKRRLSPVKTPRKIKIYRPGGTTPSKRNLSATKKPKGGKSVGYAARCIEHYEYNKAFTYLYNNFPGARRAMKNLIQKEIRKDVKRTIKNGSGVLFNDVTVENMKSFKWIDALEDLEKDIPLLHSAITSACLKEDSVTDHRGVHGKSSPGMAMAVAVILHLRAPHKVKFIQGLNSIELWRCGAHRKAITQYNHIGLCSSIATTLRLISKLRVQADDRALDMRESLERGMADGFFVMDNQMDQTQPSPPDLTEDEGTSDDTSGHSSVLMDLPESSEESSSIEEQCEDLSRFDQCPGFCIVWDNVGKMIKAAHHTTTRQNRMMLWALAYCAENRIQTSHLTDSTTVKACDINMKKFMPSNYELAEVKERMEVIVSRILVENIPAFSNMQDCVQKHIRHTYWRESSRKSTVVNLGVCQENPSTIDGTIKILENLQQYVPRLNGEVYPILCYGDGLSCERHNDAHLARSNGNTKLDKLQGLEPQVQEFHKRMLLMQDLMNTFFHGSSVAEKGTLCHLKNVFGHRSVKKDVGEAFNHVSHFVKFVTYGYVVLAAMDLCGLETLEQDLDISQIRGEEFIKSLASKVVGLFWHQLDVEDILHPPEGQADTYMYCNCNEDLGDIPMINCSGFRCKGNNWFHLQCLNMTEDDVPDDDFYCSDECRRRRNYKYCICNEDLGPLEPMIGCDNLKCQNGEWFHFKCMNLKEEPEGDWYCSSTCKVDNTTKTKKGKKANSESESDYKFNYICALVYCGLMDLVRHDAVRENDGPAMIIHWKMDMVQFHNNHHPKYVLLCHRLLAGVAGWLPERLREDSIWNRTVNLAGGPGRNIEGDLVNEFLNKEFKESLKAAGGNVTEETVRRHGQMVGGLAKTMDQVMAAEEELRYFVKKPNVDISADLRLFLKIMKKEKLLSKIPGREFKSFPSFKYETNSLHPGRLNKKLKALSKRLDKIKRCTQ